MNKVYELSFLQHTQTPKPQTETLVKSVAGSEWKLFHILTLTVFSKKKILHSSYTVGIQYPYFFFFFKEEVALDKPSHTSWV